MEGERELPQILRKAREAMSLSQEEAAAEARLPLRYIKTLEGEESSLVPDESYLIPYLRQYALLLRLEPGQVIPLLLSETRQPRVRRPPELASRARSRRRVWSAVGVVFIVAAGAFVLVRWRAERALRPSFVTRHPAPATGTPVVRSTPGQEGTAGLGTLPAAELAQELRVIAQDQTWLTVSADGEPERTVILQPGEERTWRAADHFLLTVGNAGGVKLILNGTEQPPLGGSGEVVHDLRLPPERGHERGQVLK